MRTVLIALAAGLFLATPAVAEPAFASEHVSFRDLDLSTPSGHRALQRRVKAAARRVCVTAMSGAFSSGSSVSDCYAQTVPIALEEVEKHRQRSLAMLTQPAG